MKSFLQKTENYFDDATSIGREDGFFHNSKLTSIIVPQWVTRIERFSFAYSTLVSCDILSNVLYIGVSAFAGTSLETIKLPITAIENNCFSECSSLESVVIHNSYTQLGSYCFAKYLSLTAITIPDAAIVSDTAF